MRKFVCYPCNVYESTHFVSFEEVCEHYRNNFRNFRRGLCECPYLVNDLGLKSNILIIHDADTISKEVFNRLDSWYVRYAIIDNMLYVQTLDEEHEDFVTTLF